MIQTSMQLKALIRNKSGGNNNKALVLIRNYFMEHFLERLSLSPYRDQFILKGGLLLSSMLGETRRSTMDADVTIRGFDLNEQEAQRIISDIIRIETDDNIVFEIERIEHTHDEAEYPGVRVMMLATLDKMRTPLKLDISTGDAITPREIEYNYPLMFEDRTIPILACNLETSLAEKLESIITRDVTNTRMRDFYDIYVLTSLDLVEIDYDVFRDAFVNTSATRNSSNVISRGDKILNTVREDSGLKALWQNYQAKYDYAAPFSWEEIMSSVIRLYEQIRK